MDHLVTICAKRAYRLYVAGTDYEHQISLDDLKHVGVIGYLEAESRFDESRGVDRKTFLGYRVRGSIIDWLRKQPMVSLPQTQYGRVKALKECREKLQKSGLQASDEELAADLEWEVDEVRRTGALTPYVRSLDKEIDDDGYSGYDMLADRRPQPQDRIPDREISTLIEICLKNLPSSEERLILMARMQRDIKLKHLARQFGCTPQAVHQREKRALERMKNCLQSHGWNWQENGI